jgi:protein-arginine kinase
MNKKKEFNAIAENYFVQIRGIHGEHTETNDGIFDISNLRRLGRSERQLVQDMIDGVRVLMDAEKALREEAPRQEVVAPELDINS